MKSDPLAALNASPVPPYSNPAFACPPAWIPLGTLNEPTCTSDVAASRPVPVGVDSEAGGCVGAAAGVGACVEVDAPVSDPGRCHQRRRSDASSSLF